MEPAAAERQSSGGLDVEHLLDSSLPRPHVRLLWWAAGVFLIIVLGGAVLAGHWPQGQQIAAILSTLAMLGLLGAVSAAWMILLQRYRAEQQLVERVGEMVQLRRWGEAAGALQRYLSRPSRSPVLRAQALVYLSAVLMRLHRFDEAIAVQNHLLEEGVLDGPGEAMLRIGRAMAMLREDHLFDADRAINELRRGPAAGSGGVALVELYRDVKTGHPADAIILFEQKLPLMRDQLAGRVADAYVLAAWAYDLVGRQSEAAQAFRKATLLAPLAELCRRYPEVQSLSGRYEPATAPPEAA